MDNIFADKYKIIKELGRGGMGTVYQATHMSLGRDEALKILHPEQSSDTAFILRFVREARSMARLDHANIIRIYNVFEADGMHCIAMELYNGASLRHIQQSGRRLKLNDIIAIISQAAKGLAFAHTRGIVHRDIKPSNIMIGRQLHVKLADFGVAAAMDDSSLTMTGELVGSPRYMPPEQARCDTVDSRSDLYSLGMVFYELLTGNSPFDGDSGIAIIGKLAYGEDEIILNFPNVVPKKIQHIVRKLVARKPRKRFQSADDLCQTLAELENSTDETYSDTSSPSSPNDENKKYASDKDFSKQPRKNYSLKKRYVTYTMATVLLIATGVPLYAYKDKYLSEVAELVSAEKVVSADELKAEITMLQHHIVDHEKGSTKAQEKLKGILLNEEAQKLYDETVRVHINGSTELAEANGYLLRGEYERAREMLIAAESFFEEAENQFLLAYELSTRHITHSLIESLIDETSLLKQEVFDQKNTARNAKADIHSPNEFKRAIFYLNKADKLLSRSKRLMEVNKLIKSRYTIHKASAAFTTASGYFDKTVYIATNKNFATLIESKLAKLHKYRMEINSAKFGAEHDGAVNNANALYKKAKALERKLHLHESDIKNLVEKKRSQAALTRIEHAIALAQESKNAYIKAWQKTKITGASQTNSVIPHE